MKSSTHHTVPRMMSWRMVFALLASLFLVSLISGVWASPNQYEPRQTVPTRTPTKEPTNTPEPPTLTPTLTPEPPTAIPTEEDTPQPTATDKPQKTATPPPDAQPTTTEVATAEPLPTGTLLFVLLEDKETLSRYVKPTRTPTPTATPMPTAIPHVLVNKILFKSDMFGQQRVFMVDADGSNLALLVKPWIYQVVSEKERVSPDGQYAVHQSKGKHGLDLFLGPTRGGSHSQLTFVGQGKAYDPAFSPDGHTIVFASNQEKDDDIFVVEIGAPQSPSPHTIKLTRHDDWESDKHPSYSPDGSQVVFYSNRTGKNQLWTMNADGSNPRQLLDVEGNCWDPIWIKSYYARP